MNATDPKPPASGQKQIWMWLVLAVAAAAVYIFVVVRGPNAGPEGTDSAAIGRHLAYLELEPLTGAVAPVSLNDIEGHVTLINFWGTWCPPCRAELPHIVTLASKFASNDAFRLCAVSCGQEDDRDLAELRQQTMQFLSAQGAGLDTYADQNAASRKAMMLLLGLDGFSYPTTIVFDRQGAIRGFWVGYRPGSEEQMESLVDKLLKETAT